MFSGAWFTDLAAFQFLFLACLTFATIYSLAAGKSICTTITITVAAITSTALYYDCARFSVRLLPRRSLLQPEINSIDFDSTTDTATALIARCLAY